MKRIFAVAANTIKQALRLKIAIVFTAVLLILLPVMGAVMTGDGTLKGKLQTFVSYSLSLTSLLLCLLTIIISIYTLTDDIARKQIFTVITKPIRRTELIIGKLLGVLVLDAAMLIFFAAIIYTVALSIPRFSDASEDERRITQNEFFTARTKLIPAEPDVYDEAVAEYNKRQEDATLNPQKTRKKIISEIVSRRKLEKRAAVVGQDLIWEFENVRPTDKNGSIFVRFKYDVSVNPPDLSVYSRWFVGDYRQIKFSQPMNTEIYFSERKDTIRTFCEIEVPADCVADDGYLAVGFLNVPLNNTVVIFPPEDGLQVLYKSDTFTANFIRSILLIFFRLVFLASLGLLCASFLSFPVAFLVCLVVYCSGSVSGFILESISYLGENIGMVYDYTVKPVMSLLPQFDKFNPGKFLVPAELLSWSLLAKVLMLMVVVKSALMILVSLVIFSYREIAKVIA